MEIDDHGSGVYGIVFTRTADGNHPPRRRSPISRRRSIACWRSPTSRRWCCPAKARISAPAASAPRVDLGGGRARRPQPDPRGQQPPCVPRRCRSWRQVEGKAFGFGCGFSTQCDVTIAGDGAVFALPEMSHKLPPLIVLSYFGKFVPSSAPSNSPDEPGVRAAEAKEIGSSPRSSPPAARSSAPLPSPGRSPNSTRRSVQLLRAFARRVAGLSDDLEARNGVATMAIALAARASAH